MRFALPFLISGALAQAIVYSGNTPEVPSIESDRAEHVSLSSIASVTGMYFIFKMLYKNY